MYISVIGTAPYYTGPYHTVLCDYTILKDFTHIHAYEAYGQYGTSLRLYDKYVAAERLYALYRQNLGVPLVHTAYSIIIALRSGYGKARDGSPAYIYSGQL